MVRAERNRHSAAASRERKKQLLAELARQVSELSKQNADLQIEQIKGMDEKRMVEKRLKEENAELKRAMQYLDMEYAKIQHIAENEGKGKSEFQTERRKKLSRPKTWDAGRDSWEAAARLAIAADDEEDDDNDNDNDNMEMSSPHQ